MLIYGGVLFIISLWNRYLHIDDMWFGEQAYYLANEGVVKLKSMDGILNFSERMFIYHKFHVILGALIIKVFGWSVYPMKFLTLLIYITFFYVLYRYYKQNSGTLSWPVFILSCSLIFLNPNAFLYGFMYRPDILMMTLGFIMYLFLDLHLKTSQVKWIWFSGIFAGLCFFTHLNGIIFPIAGFILLLLYKRFKAASLFFVVSASVGSLYFYDLWQDGHMDAMIYEFKNYPMLKFGKRQLNGLSGFIQIRFSSLLNEPKRFFWNYFVYPFSVLFLLSLLGNLKHLLKNQRPLLIFCSLIIVGMALLVTLKSPHYLLYFYPYMAIITAIGVFRAITLQKSHLSIIYIIGFLLQFYHMHYDFWRIFNRNEDFVSKHRMILSQIPDPSARVLVPFEYIFNKLPDYQLINISGFSYYQMDLGHPITREEFYERAIDLNIKYIILDKTYYKNEKGWMPDNLLERNAYYKSILDKKEFYLLERI